MVKKYDNNSELSGQLIFDSFCPSFC